MTDGSRTRVVNSMQHHKLFWQLVGCSRGRRHFKWCTPKSLSAPSKLWCPFCNHNADVWAQAGLSELSRAELSFMQILAFYRLDTDFCFQVVQDFWAWPADFYNRAGRYFVQVDGSCHWVGIYNVSSMVIAGRDMGFNKAAVAAGECVVRIHEGDLATPEIVHAALQATALGCSIVLTPSYATTRVSYKGQHQLYADALQNAAPSLRMTRVEHGIIVFYPM